MPRRLTTEEFVRKAGDKHPGLYDYSLVNYKGTFDKIRIVCAKHGEFSMTPNRHLNGVGCSKCAKEEREEQKRQALLDSPEEKLLREIFG